MVGDPPECKPHQTRAHGGCSAASCGEQDGIAQAASGAASGHLESFPMYRPGLAPDA